MKMAKKSTLDASIRPLLALRYWPSWLGLGVAAGISYLPLSSQHMLGKQLGTVMFHCAKRRRHIADTNLKICYPTLTEEERVDLTKRHFQSMGKGFFETFCSWFQPPEKFQSATTFEGQDVVDKLLSQKKGCILIGGHFSSIDLCGTLLAGHIPVHPIYKLQSNPVVNWVMEHKRKAVYEKTIERSNMREVLKSLKQNRIVWYAMDQDYGRSHSVFAPFFNRECATISAITRIAKLTGAPIMAFDYARVGKTFSLRLIEMKDFPLNDDIAAAKTMNGLIEQFIAPKKEQYFWTHRRFKTQKNENTPSPYDR